MRRPRAKIDEILDGGARPRRRARRRRRHVCAERRRAARRRRRPIGARARRVDQQRPRLAVGPDARPGRLRRRADAAAAADVRRRRRRGEGNVEATQSYIRNCGCATQACVADALDQYAEALAQVAPRLPPHLQDAAGIVARRRAVARRAHQERGARALTTRSPPSTRISSWSRPRTPIIRARPAAANSSPRR